MRVYWDTSAVLKLYAPESDSNRYISLIAQKEIPLYGSVLLKIELYHALFQKERRAEIKIGSAKPLYDKFLTDLQNDLFCLIPFGADIEIKSRDILSTCYQSADSVFIRSLDGIHLATALVAKCQSIVTTDKRML